MHEDDLKWTAFVLAMDSKIETPHWRQWWEDLRKMELDKFIDEAAIIFKEIAPLRKFLISG